MHKMPLYNTYQVLSFVNYIGSTYLNSIQYRVDIEEMDDDKNVERCTVSMNTFLLKMLSKEMIKHGESEQELNKILPYLDSHPAVQPNNNSVTVMTYTPLRLTGNDSKIRPER